MRRVSTVKWMGGLWLSVCLGCGGSAPPSPVEKLVPVEGIVTIGGQPAERVVLMFQPTGTTKGRGGSGVTGADGKFTALNSAQQKGLTAGTYTVTLSRWVKPDGTFPDPKLPPADSGAVEGIPPQWSQANPDNTVEIPAAGKPDLKFELPAKK